jgi:c-di-GMP-binding flagellar brake protein YcgR
MPSTDNATEKRRFDRIPETVSITIQKIAYPLTDETPVNAVGKNISAGGICFAVPQSYEPDDLLSLRINLTGWQRHKSSYAAVIDDDLAMAPLTAVAKVAWCKVQADSSDYEIGVIFENIYEDDYQALKKYLSFETPT